VTAPRHPWRTAVASAAVAVLAACSSTTSGINADSIHPGSTSPPTTATSTGTTVVSTTTSTTPATAPPTTEPPTTEDGLLISGFQPACLPTTGGSAEAGVAIDPPSLSPLGPIPALQVVAPQIRARAFQLADDPQLWPFWTPGGLLIGMSATPDVPDGGAAIGMIDRSGVTTWMRCLAQQLGAVFSAPASSSPSEALIELEPASTGGTGSPAASPSGTDPSNTDPTDTGPPSTDDGSSDPGGPLPASSWQRISLASGQVTGTLADLLPAGSAAADASWGVVHFSGDLLLLGPAFDRVLSADDELLVVDLASMSVRELPVPPDAEGTEMGSLQFAVTATGDVIEQSPLDIELGTGVRAVEHDGTWSTKAADRLAAQGIVVGFDDRGSSATPLEGIDAVGKVRWRRNDLQEYQSDTPPPIDSGIALVAACDGTVTPPIDTAPPDTDPPETDLPETDPTDTGPTDTTGDSVPDESTSDGFCDGPSLFGIDVATGHTVWRLVGDHPLSIVGHGLALVRTPESTTAAWELLDVATGAPVSSDQRWADPSAFAPQCCSASFTVADGGVIETVVGRRISVWWPRAVTPARTIAVTLF
jgi:hypothetical protein